MSSETGELPLVRQIRDRIWSQISSGRYAENEPLPSYRAWAAEFSVSPDLVREAIELLEEEQLIERPVVLRTAAIKSTGHRVRITSLSKSVSNREIERMRRYVARQHFQKVFEDGHPEVELVDREVEHPLSDIEFADPKRPPSTDPTIGLTTQTALATLVRRGLISPISGCEFWFEQLNPAIAEGCSYKGQRYMVPRNLTWSMLIFNKALFEKAKLDPNVPPRDWHEFSKFAWKLFSVTGRPSIYIENMSYLVTWLIQLAVQESGTVNETVSPQIDWHSAGAKAGVQHVVELYEAQMLSCGAERFFRRCLSGEFPIVIDITGNMAGMISFTKQADRFGVAMLPASTEGRSISVRNCGGSWVNANASPQERAVAAEYLTAREEWFRRSEGGALLKSLSLAPPLRSLLKNPASDTWLAANLPAAWREALDKIEASALWEPAESDWKKPGMCREMDSLFAGSDPLSAERIADAFSMISA